MIVVAIIGIIIAIAVPAFLRARENARGRACQENLSKIDGAKEQYALEFKRSNGTSCNFDALLNPGGSGIGYLKGSPECPTGGSYMVAAIGSNPQCTIGSSATYQPHVLPGSGPGGPDVGSAPGGGPGGGGPP